MFSWPNFAFEQLLFEVSSMNIFMETNQKINGLRYICTWISAKKTPVFGCLTNTLAPPPIALESCSRAQTDWPV